MSSNAIESGLEGPDVIHVSIPVILNHPVERVSFSCGNAPLTSSPELELITHLLPAMAQGLPLHLNESPDLFLLGHAPELMSLLCEWNPSLKPVSIESKQPPGAAPPATKPGKTALFFTGGVDSFHSLVTSIDQVDALVFVVGFDVLPEQEVLLASTIKMLKEVSASFDLPLIVVETNLRAYLDAFLPWGMSHGAALAAVAHSLCLEFDRFIVSSSFSDEQLHPWGTHPRLDPLFSSQKVKIIHGESSVTRLEKFQCIANDPRVLGHLRVCWVNPGQEYNCGSCAKCIRTQLAFDLLGLEIPPGLFSTPLNIQTVQELLDRQPLSLSDTYFYREIYQGYLNRKLEGTPFARALAGGLKSVGPLDEPVVRSEPLILHKSRSVIEAGRVTLTAEVERGGICTTLYFNYPDTQTPDRPGDALLVWFILYSMQRGCPLHIEDDVSESLLENMKNFQPLCASMPSFKGLQPIEITSGGVIPSAGKKGTSLPWMAAFGAGVDAWSLALQYQDSIGGIVYLHGIDRKVIDPEQQAGLNKVLQESAKRLHVDLMDVECNMREVLVGTFGGRWDYTYIFATAGMGHLFQHRASRMVMAGDNAYGEMQMNEVTAVIHPVLQPFLSSDAMEYEVMGMGEMRHEKVAWLCEHHPWSVPLFRLCFAGALSTYDGYRNCGVCEKCIRTQVAFRMAGHTDLATQAFDQPLDLEKLKNIQVLRHEFLSELRLLFYISMFRDLLKNGQDPELLEALRIVLENSWTTWPEWVEPCWEDPYTRWASSPYWPQQLNEHAEAWVEAALKSVSNEELEAWLMAHDSPLAFMLNDHHLDSKIRKKIRSCIPLLNRQEAS